MIIDLFSFDISRMNFCLGQKIAPTGINLNKDSNEYKIRMVQDPCPGRQERQTGSACTDHFARDTRHKVHV